MKQILFETRHKADELLKDALAIWRQSDQSERLEGLEKDPVFSLLLMALAYLSNEADGELERLKADVQEDFARTLVPYELGHATPATAVVETALQYEVTEFTVNENMPFQLTGHPFIPLLETRVINAEVRSVIRLDGRRFKVTVNFKHPVSDLSGFAFAIRDVAFRNVDVSLKGQLLPLIKPWHFADIPFTPSFAPDALTYNLGQVFNLSMLPMDLYARQNVRMFCIEKHSPRRFIQTETSQIELVFEFSGIAEDFHFDKNCLCLNPVMLVNAEVHEATLSSASPLVRLIGDTADKDLSSRQFMHLVRPMENQLFGNVELDVRRVAGDRFNQGSLVKLLNCIISKFHSDYYAFQELDGNTTEGAVYLLEMALARLKEVSTSDAVRNVSGVYLMPRRKEILREEEDFSLTVKYLTTAGAAINSMLGPSSQFTAPSGFLPDGTHLIAPPVPGTDEIQDDRALSTLMRYQVMTSDRIVTMADIKLFCLKELMVRFGIGNNLVNRLRLNRRRQRDDSSSGYEIVAEIMLTGNSFVRRSIADKLPQTEFLLEQMIAVRSTNIYPVRVNISIKEET